ncbi:MAG: DinB family protein [Chitinophagaceae bacterium]
MKEILRQYASYNIWASQRLINCILELPVEWQVKEVPSSFPSLHATLMHMWDAENIWWQRMKLQEVVTSPGTHFKGTTGDVANEVLNQARLWESWVTAASQPALDHVFHYQNTKREQFKQPVYQMLLHVFNHGTYHRGQLVSILRQLDVQKIPATDFIVFSRKK